MFDTDSLLNSTFSDANATTYEPCPEGEYPAAVDTFKPRTFKNRDGEESVVLDIFWLPQLSAEQEQALGRKPKVKQTLFLDTTPSGGLDMGKGKNIGLGRLREALGQNQPGKPWNFGMLMGGTAVVKVQHRMYEGNIFDEIKEVRPIS
jgi:hypothetical protein